MQNSDINIDENQDLIIETDTKNFMKDVVEGSKDALILIDFWAPWCGPCKQLTPILEEVVREFDGIVRLVKINVDENQAIAAQFRVQSIPAVFAFKNERPVDGFMGALSKSQIIEFVNKHLDEEMLKNSSGVNIKAELKAANKFFEAKDYIKARDIYVSLFQIDSENLGAILGIAKCFIALKEFDNAKEIMALVPEDKAGDAEVKRINSKITLAENALSQDEIQEFLDRLNKNENDHDAMMELAKFYNNNDEKEKAVDMLILSIKKDRTYNNKAARKLLLELFDSWGFKDQASVKGRKQLSSVLFA